jgi:DNA-binding response OmpR family regulator
MWRETVLYGMVMIPEVPPRGEVRRQPESPADLAGRIIIAEDEYFVALALEQDLLEAGHDVLAIVSTGEEAVREGSRLRPDLVLMDIRLAGEMSGVEAAMVLRAHGVTSLFATAHTDAGTHASGEKAMPAGWLTKPYSGAELVSAVAAALSRNRGH